MLFRSPTFGGGYGGHDLCLVNGFLTAANNYCNCPSTYKTVKKSELTGGKYNFKVKECEVVPKSKKLLKFVLDDGTGVDRVILSGIHEYYEPEELVGKTCIAITNLPPRAMMGIDSCGMLISAVHEEDGKEGLNLLMVDDKIPAGAKLY